MSRSSRNPVASEVGDGVLIDLIILGASGTGLDVLDWVDGLNAIEPRYRCLGFLDDDQQKHLGGFAGLPVLGTLEQASSWPTARFVDALGSPTGFLKRPAIVGRTGLSEERFETLVHPAASVSSRAQLGSGILVYPQVTIGPNVQLGNHVQVLANSVINHDTRIGQWTIVASGASISGKVRVGACCYIGTGAVLKESISVADGAMVGMGAIVIRNIQASESVVGNPARPLHRDS
jgi:sugar O-acyltransferase (sialic acid O-acetyltransferase NeuD family)